MTLSSPVPSSSLDPDAPIPSQRKRRRLGEVLVTLGLLSADQLKAGLAEQQRPAKGRRRRLGEVLTDMGMLTERQLAGALAEALNIDLIDLAQVPVRVDDARLLPKQLAERHTMMVIGRSGGALLVAVADPTNVVGLDDVRLYTRTPDLIVVVATAGEIRDHLNRAWGLHATPDVVLVEDSEAVEEDLHDISDAPVVKLAGQIFSDAVRLHASDVHLEPQHNNLRIRFRVDGVLREIMTVPRSTAPTLIGRVKVMAGLDIAERRRPQDGRTRLQLEDSFVDARVSTLPTLHGEKLVIRLLPRAAKVPTLQTLGFEGDQLDSVLRCIAEPQGLVLLTGPTGSGKTNTLYAALSELKDVTRNIVTLEDPVEIEQPGIAQVQINEKAGVTFARGLRAVLRQDPDIVLVGEVRDTETADLALRASMTGHLVMTTMHTNDAASAVTRLIDMGIAPYMLASSLTLVVAQRLLRRPCRRCLVDDVPTEQVLTALGLRQADLRGATPKRGTGCLECGHTGYFGRIGVFEVLPVGSAFRRVLLADPTERALRVAAAEAGILSVRAGGLAKAARGETTYEEVLRATREDTDDGKRCTGCERALGDDMVGCPWCGAAAPTDSCAACGHPVSPEWVRCPYCRAAEGKAEPTAKPVAGRAAGRRATDAGKPLVPRTPGRRAADAGKTA
ncbi:MAG: type secretion system protein [Frankiales bacterium]|nr:type secretion system protein [Frankiales bacterium]